MTAMPVPLIPRPAIDFDEDVLQSIMDRHGDAAERHIAGLLAELERMLSHVALQARRGTLGGLERGCEDLLPLARAVGMASLERAAEGVLNGLRRGDATVLAACTVRLLSLARPDAFHDWAAARGTVA